MFSISCFFRSKENTSRLSGAWWARLTGELRLNGMGPVCGEVEGRESEFLEWFQIACGPLLECNWTSLGQSIQLNCFAGKLLTFDVLELLRDLIEGIAVCVLSAGHHGSHERLMQSL